MRRINVLKTKRAEREAQEMNEAQELARRINKLKLAFELETGETGKAFGSITASDIADRIRAELGGNVENRSSSHRAPKALKESGKHEVEVKLHHDITATLKVTVSPKAHRKRRRPRRKTARSRKSPAGGYKAKAKAKQEGIVGDGCGSQIRESRPEKGREASPGADLKGKITYSPDFHRYFHRLPTRRKGS